MRWEREWRRSIADVENLVFPWHRHTVSEIAVHVKHFAIDLFVGGISESRLLPASVVYRVYCLNRDL